MLEIYKIFDIIQSMPKLKTHKGLSKRIKLSGSKTEPKLMHTHQFDNNHLKVNKSALKKNRMEGKSALKKTDETKKLLKFIRD